MASDSSDPQTLGHRPAAEKVDQTTSENERNQTTGENQRDQTGVVEEPEAVNGGEEEFLSQDEEEGECGFCLFMKGGGCRESFIDWENCVEEAEKTKEDIVEKCFEVTAKLKKCMEANSDYYEPILRAEKAAEEEAVKELERESAEEKSGVQNATRQPRDEPEKSS